MDRLDMRFPSGSSLENRVVGSPRLLSLIPDEELAPKVAAYNAAKRAAKDAVNVPAAVDDVTEEVRTALRAGEDVDAAAMVQRLAQQSAYREARNNAVAFFRALPEEYKYDVAAVIRAHVSTMYAGLAEQLDEVLDAGEAALAALDGAFTAEAAIAADRVKEFKVFHDLAATYVSIRAAHIDLLQGEAAGTFGAGASTLGYALYEDIEAGFPDFLAVSRDGRHAGGWTRYAEEPFPLLSTDDPEHWVGVLRHRATMKPHVVSAADAVAARKAAVAAKNAEAADQSQGLEMGDALTSRYGGERGVLRNHRPFTG